MNIKELKHPVAILAIAGIVLGMLTGLVARPGNVFAAFPDGGGAAGTGATQPAGTSATTQTAFTSLVLHVYFQDAAERDRLATELGAEEVSTRGGYLTV